MLLSASLVCAGHFHSVSESGYNSVDLCGCGCSLPSEPLIVYVWFHNIALKCFWQEICRHWSDSVVAVLWRFIIDESVVRLCHCARSTGAGRHLRSQTGN